MFHLYKSVPPCPSCGSEQTGYYYVDDYAGKMVAFYLKLGELVRPANNTNLNCFCEECGTDWYTPLNRKIISESEFQEELRKRDIISEDASNYRQFLKEDRVNTRKEEKEKKHARRKAGKYNFIKRRTKTISPSSRG